ncbi:MAG: TPM domain-containing protein [Oscillospiraceae bacterium]|jgi:uncharacterized membrane protein YgcG|nr:TPM domain-containing protein [Oscillospiraceae bacterium]MDR2360320.1 TPM domain-containing protein [Oscillospiraceae bacterium]
MRFIKSRSFALIVLIAVIAAALIAGHIIRASRDSGMGSAQLTDSPPVSYPVVYDNGNLLSNSTEQEILYVNEKLYAQNGGQIIVVTDTRLPSGYADSEVYSRYLFELYGVNGLLLYFTERADNRVYLSYGNNVGLSDYEANSLLERYFYRDYDYKDYNGAVMNIIPELSKELRGGSGGGKLNGFSGLFFSLGGFAIVVIFIILLFAVLILAAIATTRRNAYIRGPRYVRTGPFPSWFWFLPGFYSGSRYRAPRVRRPPSYRPNSRHGGSGGTRPSRPSNFGGGAGRSGGFSGGAGRK